MPTDDRARRVAEGLLARPADFRRLDEWGGLVGASDRTLMGAFVAETGLTFHEWRTRSRIRAALPRLAGGAQVAVVAPSVGYATSSAFAAVFKRTMGTTASAFFGSKSGSVVE